MAPTRTAPQKFNWTRIFDYGQRAVVFSCLAVSIWAVGASVMLHRHTMKRNEELLADKDWVAQRKIEIAQKAAEKEKEKELDLATRAQAAIPSRRRPQPETSE